MAKVAVESIAKASAGHSSQFQVTKSFFILSILQWRPIGIEYVTAIAWIMSQTEKWSDPNIVAMHKVLSKASL